MNRQKKTAENEKPLNRVKLSILIAIICAGALLGIYVIAGILPPIPLDYSDTEIYYDNDDLNAEYEDAGYENAGYEDTVYKDAGVITLNDSGITCNASGVIIEESSVKITKEGSYILTGSLSDGCIYIASGDAGNVQLIFSDADITCKSSPPIYVQDANKVIISTAEGTANKITAVKKGGLESAVYCACDLTFNGAGSLNIVSENGVGVNCQANVRIAGGCIELDSKEDSIKAYRSVSIIDGSLNITSQDDGIITTGSGQANGKWISSIIINGGTININSEGDALNSGSVICITGGTINIVTAGGSSEQTQSADFNRSGPENTSTNKSEKSAKALKASSGVCISGGNISIDSADDGINSKNNILITDGTIIILCNDDGITAENLINIQGGTIDITRSVEGIEAHYIVIDDGNISVISSDDGFNATSGSNPIAKLGKLCEMEILGTGGRLIINGGTIDINAGGDGLDANGSIIQTGGDVTVTVSGRGADTAIDYDGSYTAAGGTIEQNTTSSGNDFGGGPGQMPDGMSGGMPDGMPGGMHLDPIHTAILYAGIGIVIIIVLILIITVIIKINRREKKRNEGNDLQK